MSDPIMQAQTYFTEMIRKAGEEQLSRLNHFSEEAAKLEGTLVQAATTAFAESTKQVVDGIAYAGQVSQEFRKMTLQAARKATDALPVVAKAKA